MLCLGVENNDSAKSVCLFCKSMICEMSSAAKRVFHVRFAAGLFISNFPRVTWIISVRAATIHQQVHMSLSDGDSSVLPMHLAKSDGWWEQSSARKKKTSNQRYKMLANPNCYIQFSSLFTSWSYFNPEDESWVCLTVRGDISQLYFQRIVWLTFTSSSAC